jgi:ankyrin repeat protein
MLSSSFLASGSSHGRFKLHDAAETGDIDALADLIRRFQRGDASAVGGGAAGALRLDGPAHTGLASGVGGLTGGNGSGGHHGSAHKGPEGLDSYDDSGRSAMHLAAAKGFPRAVEMLADAGADVDLPREEDARTALHIAANEGNALVIAALLSRGANPGPRDVGGWRPLHVASYYGSAVVADLLLRAGARADARTGGRGAQSPLHVAVEMAHGSAWPRRDYDYPMLIRLLLAALEAQAPVALGLFPLVGGGGAEGAANAPGGDNNTTTPSAFASTPAQRARIRAWVAERVDARDGYGRAPLEVATLNLDTEVMRLLLRHGASPGRLAATAAARRRTNGGEDASTTATTATTPPPLVDPAWSAEVAAAAARRQAESARGEGGGGAGAALRRLTHAFGSLMRGTGWPGGGGGGDGSGAGEDDPSTRGGGGSSGLLRTRSRGSASALHAAGGAAAEGEGAAGSAGDSGGGGGFVARVRRLSLGGGGGESAARRSARSRGQRGQRRRRRSSGGTGGDDDNDGGTQSGQDDDGDEERPLRAADNDDDDDDDLRAAAAAAPAMASEPSAVVLPSPAGPGGGGGVDCLSGGGGAAGAAAGGGAARGSSAAPPPLPLHVAVSRGCTPACELLLEHGADIDAADASGRTPLLIAVEANSPAMIAWLLERGASARIVPPSASSAAAADNGGGGATQPPQGFHALHYAVRQALPSAALALLQHDPSSADAEDARGYTPLAAAAERGDASLCELLVARGADVGHRDAKRRISALHVAIYNGRDEVTRWLLEKGADPNAADANGHAALHVAALLNRGALVGALLAHGADVSLRDARGKTAEDLATECGSEDVLRQFDVLHRL